jgi:GT2 family glycosyltransferase
VNPDARVSRSVLVSLVSALTENPGLAVVAPAMHYPDGHRGISGGADPGVLKELISIFGIRKRVPKTVGARVERMVSTIGPSAWRRTLKTLESHSLEDIDWVSGFCMLIRREAWETLGGLDESYFMYFEDVDFCSRARSRGWGVAMDGRVSALHYESASSTTRIKSDLYRKSAWTYMRRKRTRQVRQRGAM